MSMVYEGTTFEKIVETVMESSPNDMYDDIELAAKGSYVMGLRMGIVLALGDPRYAFQLIGPMMSEKLVEICARMTELVPLGGQENNDDAYDTSVN